MRSNSSNRSLKALKTWQPIRIAQSVEGLQPAGNLDATVACACAGASARVKVNIRV